MAMLEAQGIEEYKRNLPELLHIYSESLRSTTAKNANERFAASIVFKRRHQISEQLLAQIMKENDVDEISLSHGGSGASNALNSETVSQQINSKSRREGVKEWQNFSTESTLITCGNSACSFRGRNRLSTRGYGRSK
jgi:hypothetical protein